MDFQPIEPIRMLWQSSIELSSVGEKEDAQQPSMFSDIFQSVLGSVREADASKNEQEYLLATGQLDNPADLTIAASQYQAAVTLMVQLRNKALDAYNELMRISI